MTLNLVLVAKPQEFPAPICFNQQTEGEISLHLKCQSPKTLKHGGVWFLFVVCFFNVE